MRVLVMMCALAAGVATPSLAQQPEAKDEPMRQVGAHAHGQGKLGIAFERKTVEMEVEAPGSDIVGFEHAAKTAEQKATVAKARATLAKPLALFKVPDAAGCKVVSAKVKLVGGGAHDHGHGHSHGKAAPKDKADSAPHSEFHGEYKLTCAKPELVGTITLDYFTVFPGAQALEVAVVWAKGEERYKATREKPVVTLKPRS